MFFRNLTLFRFSPATASSLTSLGVKAADFQLHPCGALEMHTSGFVSPFGHGDTTMTRELDHYTLFTVGGEDKLLPPSVVSDEVDRKVRLIIDEEDRKVSGKERKRIKEEVITELLPRAFVRSSRLNAYTDTQHGWLVIDTASAKAAENAVTQVREALGTFPAVPLAPERDPRMIMTDWLATGSLPDKFELGDECELRDPATDSGARWKGKREDLSSEDVKEHLRSGKQVFSLGLVFDNRISFVLSEDLVIHKLKFLDVVMDDLDADAKSELDATFTLMTLELHQLLTKISSLFGVHRP